MRRNFLGTALIILGVLALLGAAGLFGYNMLEEQNAGESSQLVLESLMDQMPTAPAPTVPQESVPGETQPQLPPEIQIPNYMLYPGMDLPIRESDGREYVGIIEIPDLGVELPILSEWSKSGAKVAPCRYVGTPYQGTMVICAHNYNSHFGRLNTLKTGAKVYFTDMDGNTFCYEAVAFEVLQPNQVEEMCSEQWDLTLFTCTIGGQTRFVVRCLKV